MGLLDWLSREWIHSKDTHQGQKKKKTNKSEERRDKIKHSRIIWMLSRMRSTMKQKCLRKSEEPCEPQSERGSQKEMNQSLEDISGPFPIPVLPKDGLQIPQGSPSIPCGAFTEIRSVQLSHCPVTLKCGTNEISSMNYNTLRKEIAVLTKIHHPNILLLMGVIKFQESDIVTIFEEASHGTLHHLLHCKKIVLSPTELQKFMADLCQVMMFLHDRGWIHTAISSHTIVISTNSTLKLTGFEMACQSHKDQIYNLTSKSTKNQWFQWESPEQLLSSHSLNPKTDIFSVGLVFWEMCTSMEPWRGYTYEEISKKYESLVNALGPKGLNLLIIPIEYDIYVSCLQQMLQIDPRERISSFLQVLTQIHNSQSIQKRVSVSDYLQPAYGVGTIKKTQLLFQPQPQRAMFTSNTKKNLYDRDPYTGLKRVSNSRRKLSDKLHDCGQKGNFHSSVNLEVNSQSTPINKDREQRLFHVENKRKDEEKGRVAYNCLKKSRMVNNKNEDFVTKNQYCTPSLTRKTETISDINESVRKRSISSCNSVLMTGEEDRLNRSNPIKPASHHNQKAIGYARNNSNLIYKDKYQDVNIFHQRPLLDNRENLAWRHSTSKAHQYRRNTDIMKDSSQTIKNKFGNNIANEQSLYSSTEKQTQYSKHPHNSPSSNIDKHIKVSMILNNKDKHLDHENKLEQKTKLARTSEMMDSRIIQKESEFESTDSGIFTTSKEMDSENNKTDSTEDLYIDDEFCLDMELDSHMQLLCLFDTSIYNDDSSDITQLDSENNDPYL